MNLEDVTEDTSKPERSMLEICSLITSFIIIAGRGLTARCTAYSPPDLHQPSKSVLT
jgi:hypothetical protein